MKPLSTIDTLKGKRVGEVDLLSEEKSMLGRIC